MAFPLSRKFLEALHKATEEEKGLRDVYISQHNEDGDVCIDGWFELEKLEEILKEVCEK